MLSCIQLFATPWTVACQAPLSVGFSRQKYWSGLPFPPAGDFPNPGIIPVSPQIYQKQASSGELFILFLIDSCRQDLITRLDITGGIKAFKN